MPSVHQESDHLEEILSKLISDAPKMIVIRDESENGSSSSSNNELLESPTESSPASSGLASPVGSDAHQASRNNRSRHTVTKVVRCLKSFCKITLTD